MSTIVIARGGAEPGQPSARTVAAGVVIAGSLALIGIGAFWMLPGEPAPRPQATPAAAPAAPVAPAVSTPAPVCVDGKPTADGVAADTCI